MVLLNSTQATCVLIIDISYSSGRPCPVIVKKNPYEAGPINFTSLAIRNICCTLFSVEQYFMLPPRAPKLRKRDVIIQNAENNPNA